jgi:hypothetical protein
MWFRPKTLEGLLFHLNKILDGLDDYIATELNESSKKETQSKELLEASRYTPRANVSQRRESGRDRSFIYKERDY